MPSRRDAAPVADYNRLAIRLEDKVENMGSAITDRLEAIAERLDARTGRIEHDVAMSRQVDEQARQHVLNQMAEVREDTGALRDAVNELRQQVTATSGTVLSDATKSAAEGAAAGTGKAMDGLTKVGLSKPQAWYLMAGVTITTLASSAEGLPKIAKFVAGIFGALLAMK